MSLRDKAAAKCAEQATPQKFQSETLLFGEADENNQQKYWASHFKGAITVYEEQITFPHGNR